MADVPARLMKVKVQCPGKVILFGEHASVYGYPSLVTTVSAHTQVSVELFLVNSGLYARVNAIFVKC